MHSAHHSNALLRPTDGDHYQPSQLATLETWWPYLRPGGVYAIEDISTGANHKGPYGGGDMAPAGFAPIAHEATRPERKGVPSLLSPFVKNIFKDHDSFFADTVRAHRARTARKRWTQRLHACGTLPCATCLLASLTNYFPVPLSCARGRALHPCMRAARRPPHVRTVYILQGATDAP